MTILVEEKDVKCLFYPHNTTYEKYFPKNHSCNTKYLDCISQCHLLNLRIWCGDKIYVFKANPCLLMNNFPDHMLHCDFSKYTQRHIDSVEKIEYGYIFFPSFSRWGKMGNILAMAKCKKTSKRRSHWKFVGSEKEMLYER